MRLQSLLRRRGAPSHERAFVTLRSARRVPRVLCSVSVHIRAFDLSVRQAQRSHRLLVQRRPADDGGPAGIAYREPRWLLADRCPDEGGAAAYGLIGAWQDADQDRNRRSNRALRDSSGIGG